MNESSRAGGFLPELNMSVSLSSFLDDRKHASLQRKLKPAAARYDAPGISGGVAGSGAYGSVTHVTRLESQLASTQKELAWLKRKLGRANEKVKELQAVIERQGASLDREATKVRNVSVERKAAESEKRRLSRGLNAQLRDSRAEVHRLELTIEAMQVECRTLRRERDEHASSLDAMEQSMETYKEQHQLFTMNKMAMSKALADERRENAALRAQLKEARESSDGAERMFGQQLAALLQRVAAYEAQTSAAAAAAQAARDEAEAAQAALAEAQLAARQERARALKAKEVAQAQAEEQRRLEAEERAHLEAAAKAKAEAEAEAEAEAAAAAAALVASEGAAATTALLSDMAVSSGRKAGSSGTGTMTVAAGVGGRGGAKQKARGSSRASAAPFASNTGSARKAPSKTAGSDAAAKSSGLRDLFDGLDDETIYKSAFKHFDKDGSGSIDATEIRKIMRGFGQRLSAEEAATMVKEADKDGNGEIDYEEFRRIMIRKKKSEHWDQATALGSIHAATRIQTAAKMHARRKQAQKALKAQQALQKRQDPTTGIEAPDSKAGLL